MSEIQAISSSGAGFGFLITVSGSGSTGYTLDKTGREIIDAVNAGFAPVFKYTSGNDVHIYSFTRVSYNTYSGSVDVRSSGWGTSFTAVGFDNYPSIAPSGGDN